jgi:photosystem II stability/assembly factor-like uncharacterized protein
MKKNKVVVILAVIVVFFGFYLTQQRKTTPLIQKNDQRADSDELKQVNSITHGHGLSIDVVDPKNVYIATHHGLLLLKNDKDLYQIGDKKDDYMGFSSHPTDPNIFFSSGHPETGGNIGFQKSKDGGFTWEKVSDGLNGPVDYHAMTVSSANPNLIYGWFQGSLQRSTDEGKNWEIVSTTSFPIVNLTADPKDENIVYAASPQGLMISKDKGTEWTKLFDGFVSAIAINPQDSQKLLTFSQKYRFAKSNDRGKTWETISETFGSESPLFITFSKQNSKIVYTLTEKNSIYKSTDGGNN